MIELYDIDYNRHMAIIGTAHFTRRSLNDAYEAVAASKPSDICVELDWRRFRILNATCTNCPKRELCRGLCEFTGASDALGNVDANIWLIDMTEQEMRQRIRGKMSPFERSRISVPFYSAHGDPVLLWERGFKEKVIEDSKRSIEVMRKTSPAVCSVLIDERNALMAARLAWIATKNLDEGKESKMLTFVGAAHIEGISSLLRNPSKIRDELRRFNLPYTRPTLIRRVAVQGN